MATIKQIEANRRNALKSTGPRTPEAKAAVRMNALRHGLRARTVVLPAENPQEFHQLCNDLETEWQPQSRGMRLVSKTNTQITSGPTRLYYKAFAETRSCLPCTHLRLNRTSFYQYAVNSCWNW